MELADVPTMLELWLAAFAVQDTIRIDALRRRWPDQVVRPDSHGEPVDWMAADETSWLGVGTCQLHQICGSAEPRLGWSHARAALQHGRLFIRGLDDLLPTAAGSVVCHDPRFLAGRTE